MNDLRQIFRLFAFILIQILILNSVDFLGYAEPHLYLIFFITYPYKQNNFFVLFLGFFSGLILDIFCDTGGIFSASTLILIFFRQFLIKLFMGDNFEYNKPIKLLHLAFAKRFWFLLLLVLIFNISFYFLEAFSFDLFFETITKVLVNSVLTFVFLLIYSYWD